MGWCAVFGCSEKGENGLVKLFRFPKDKKMCKIWQNKCKRSDAFSTIHTRICSKHFSKSQYNDKVRLKYSLLKTAPRNIRLLKPNAEPDINLPKQLFGSVTGTDEDVCVIGKCISVQSNSTKSEQGECLQSELDIGYRPYIHIF